MKRFDKLVKQLLTETPAPAPTTKPKPAPTTPGTPTKPSKPTRPSPITPTRPGISPNPMAKKKRGKEEDAEQPVLRKPGKLMVTHYKR